MTSFEQALLEEVAALPPARRADVLAFVRYLRLSLMDEAELEIRYDSTVAAIFTMQSLEERAKRGSREMLLEILNNAPDVEPEASDRL